MGEQMQLGDHDFCLLLSSVRRPTLTAVTKTKVVVLPVKPPHLGLAAHVYDALGATSCQAEIHIYSVSFLDRELRTHMTTTKVEQIVCFAAKQGEHPHGLGLDSGYP